MLRLWVKDNTTGEVHEYGTSRHDSLILMEDGSLHYENMQCCVGTQFPEEGYSFCREDGTVPNPYDIENGDEVIDIGGAKDFAPVVRGRWLPAGLFEDFAKCSVCGSMEYSLHEVYRRPHRYCINCGAKMDLDARHH